MAIEVKRKDNENFLSLLRRFKKRIRASRVLREARGRRFKTQKLNRRQIKLSALHKTKMLKHYEKLRKLGKLDSRY